MAGYGPAAFARVGGEMNTLLDAAMMVLEPGSVAELRILNTNKKTVSGYFDDFDKLAQAAAEWNGKVGVYFTLNPVNPDLLARSSNHLTEWARLTTSDTDIARRRWLPVDCDPVRPTGISSTEAEHDAAIARTKEIGQWLGKQGWQRPVWADSGNGGHLLYRIDLPNDSDSTLLVQRCLEALDLRFSDDAVTVDVTNHNPARIWKLYGTTAAKGDSTADRPHRVSKVLSKPSAPETVDVALLRKLADTVPKPDPKAHPKGGADFDLETWLQTHNLPVARNGDWQQGSKWLLNPCPWNGDHTDNSAYIVQFSNGAIAAGCHHNGCTGNDWPALRGLYEPDYERRRDQRRDGASAAKESTAPEPVTYRGPPPKLALLLADVLTYIRHYVVLSDAQADAITLWVAHTHAFDAVESTPYLSITSAEKRSGKTLLLEVLELIVSRPWLTGRVSAAALYRRVDKERPTLLLDESDSAFKSGEEYAESLRGVLNTGYRRSGSTTVCVQQGANTGYVIFSTFAPKAIAGIGRLPDTVEDRSISIVLRRKAPGETAARFKYRKVREEAASLKQGLEAWASHSESLVEAEPDLPEALDDRARDGWEVLLAIADLAGDGWPQRGRIAALALSVGDGREDESEGVLLLSHIRDIFAQRGDPDKITSADLIRALVRLEEAPWGDLKGRSLDARGLAKRLRPFIIKPRSIRLDGGAVVRGYLRESFVLEWARYLPTPTPESPLQVLQVLQTPDTDTGDVADVADVALNTGMGEGGEKAQSTSAFTQATQPDTSDTTPDDGQRLYARSLWEGQGSPASVRLSEGKTATDPETVIDSGNADDLAALIEAIEGTI